MSNSNEIRNLRLENLIKEAVTLALFEQQPVAQPQAVAANPVPPAPPAPAPDMTAQLPPEEPVAPQDQAPPAQQMTIDSMIERLNVIRGGKSFTDPEVYGQLVSYFKKITPEQNQVIDQYLQDVSRIMINVRAGISAEDEQTPQQTQGLQPPNSGGTQPTPGGQPPISAGAGATAPAPAPVTAI
jgi:hypothetical protein